MLSGRGPDLNHGSKRKEALVTYPVNNHQVLFFKDFIYLFILERGKRREKEGEKHRCVVVSPMPPTGDLAQNPDMCPVWVSKQLSLSSQAHTQSTESHHPGYNHQSFKVAQYSPQ